MKNLKLFLIPLVSSFVLYSCGGGNDAEEEAWEDFNDSMEEYDEVEVIDSSIPQTLSLFDDKLSVTIPGNFVLVASDEKPPGNGVLVANLEQYGLAESDEIVFSCIYQQMVEEGQNTQEFFDFSSETPRPNTSRVSIELVTINDTEWAYEQYETEMEEGTVVVDNFACMDGTEIYTVQAICDKPVYEEWSSAIEDFKNSIEVK